MTGARSESAAADYLRQQGYEILECNFYCRYGELDIVARDKQEYVFVEVKSIVGNPEISPYELLQPRKISRLEYAIDYWLALHGLQRCDWRFEFIAIVLDSEYKMQTLEHIRQPEL